MYRVYRVTDGKKLLVSRTRTMERAALLGQKLTEALRIWRNDTDSILIEKEGEGDDGSRVQQGCGHQAVAAVGTAEEPGTP